MWLIHFHFFYSFRRFRLLSLGRRTHLIKAHINCPFFAEQEPFELLCKIWFYLFLNELLLFLYIVTLLLLDVLILWLHGFNRAIPGHDFYLLLGQRTLDVLRVAQRYVDVVDIMVLHLIDHFDSFILRKLDDIVAKILVFLKNALEIFDRNGEQGAAFHWNTLQAEGPCLFWESEYWLSDP